MSGHIDHGKFLSWTKGVPADERAFQQVRNAASLPFVHRPAVMPDVHVGIGATVGSVIPTERAIIPAAVGVDIGCGMIAQRLEGVSAADLPDSLSGIRAGIEKAVPVGFAQHHEAVHEMTGESLRQLARITAPYDDASRLIQKATAQMGTLGGGNHFIEICLDEADNVWVMLHSGSRGVGNILGTRFIELAREDMRIHHINLPDRDLAYLSEGTELFDRYIDAMLWAQDYARQNRVFMLTAVLAVLARYLPPFRTSAPAVNCHHNYAEREHHFGKNLWVTRKGAVRARWGDLGIIPGSMGARSYIVRGKGNPLSYHSCSHGAGRVMSRKQAKASISLAQHVEATRGVECRKDEGVLDESPAAYKDVDAVMAAQDDLVEIVATLRQVVCVKG